MNSVEQESVYSNENNMADKDVRQEREVFCLLLFMELTWNLSIS